jgi:hypothetical protein
MATLINHNRSPDHFVEMRHSDLPALAYRSAVPEVQVARLNDRLLRGVAIFIPVIDALEEHKTVGIVKLKVNVQSRHRLSDLVPEVASFHNICGLPR